MTSTDPLGGHDSVDSAVGRGQIWDSCHSHVFSVVLLHRDTAGRAAVECAVKLASLDLLVAVQTQLPSKVVLTLTSISCLCNCVVYVVTTLILFPLFFATLTQSTDRRSLAISLRTLKAPQEREKSLLTVSRTFRTA